MVAVTCSIDNNSACPIPDSVRQQIYDQLGYSPSVPFTCQVTNAVHLDECMRIQRTDFLDCVAANAANVVLGNIDGQSIAKPRTREYKQIVDHLFHALGTTLHEGDRAHAHWRKVVVVVQCLGSIDYRSERRTEVMGEYPSEQVPPTLGVIGVMQYGLREHLVDGLIKSDHLLKRGRTSR